MSTVLVAPGGSVRATDAHGDWVAYHVFYGGSPAILLTECLVPLAESLVAAGIVEDWFYINYWLEGSHVRLRLRAADGHDEDDIDARVLPVVGEYLARKPSMHPMLELTDNGFYEKLFQGEFTDADRPLYFDAEGSARFRPNNSIERRPYERETYRYGGPECMALAERHFVASTQLACDVMARGNHDVRTLLLGIATQLTFVTASALLRDRALIADFFVAYHHRWTEGYADDANYASDAGRRTHRDTTTGVERRVVPLHDKVSALDPSLPERLRDWAEFNTGVRDDLDALYARGVLRFDYREGRRAPESADAAAWSLCHSLIHMTNNRMMVSVADEGFIAYQIARAMGAMQ